MRFDRTPNRVGLLVLVLSGWFTAPSARAGYVTVDLAPYANARIQDYQPSAAGYPEGMVTLGEEIPNSYPFLP
jgi:hypothetical protein